MLQYSRTNYIITMQRLPIVRDCCLLKRTQRRLFICIFYTLQPSMSFSIICVSQTYDVQFLYFKTINFFFKSLSPICFAYSWSSVRLTFVTLDVTSFSLTFFSKTMSFVDMIHYSLFMHSKQEFSLLLCLMAFKHCVYRSSFTLYGNGFYS